ncbi:MAG: phytanoyl-CoA dioxygenase, partial [Roseiflexaceae bacterium]
MTQVPATIRVGFVDATPLLSDPIALRAQAQRDGYLFFKQLLPKSDVQTLRTELLQLLAKRGWLRSDVPLD